MAWAFPVRGSTEKKSCYYKKLEKYLQTRNKWFCLPNFGRPWFNCFFRMSSLQQILQTFRQVTDKRIVVHNVHIIDIKITHYPGPRTLFSLIDAFHIQIFMFVYNIVSVFASPYRWFTNTINNKWNLRRRKKCISTKGISRDVIQEKIGGSTAAAT